MAITEVDTNVNTFIQVSYSVPVNNSNLMRREVHRIKDEDTVDFVIVKDTESNVGEKDDWRNRLQDDLDDLVVQKADMIDSFDDQIELLQEQIDEIDSL